MRSVSQCLSFIRTRSIKGPRVESGMCKKECGTVAYGIPSDGTPDATAAWRETTHRFRGQWVRGAFCYWTGGSQGHGHVAICAWRKGYVWSMDILRDGYWDKVPISLLESEWKLLTWGGMALDINGQKVRDLPSRRFRRLWSHG